jgi:hypothetical protein
MSQHASNKRARDSDIHIDWHEPVERVYERFTKEARDVMQIAFNEARRLKHEYVGTEHILLGLLIEGPSVAAKALENLGVDEGKSRIEVLRIDMVGTDDVLSGHIPTSPRVKRVIQRSLGEARDLEHCFVAPEHILLSLAQEEEGVGAEVLKNLGLSAKAIREEVLKVLGLPSDTARENTRLASNIDARNTREIFVVRKKTQRVIIGTPVKIEIRVVDFHEDIYHFDNNYAQLGITALGGHFSGSPRRIQWGQRMTISPFPFLVKVVLDRFTKDGVTLGFSLPHSVSIHRGEHWDDFARFLDAPHS